MLEFLPVLLDGAVVTVQITAVASMLAIALAVLAGLARLSRLAPLRWAVTGYVELFRGTSLLVQLFWMFFVLPHFGIRLDPFPVAVLTLGLCIGAYGSEIVRGAVLAVPRTQIEAAIALNMTPFYRMRRVVLPQAFVTMLLPWGSLLIILLKSTALVSLITLQDISFHASQINMQTFRTAEVFTLTLILYFVLAQVIAVSVGLLYRHASRGLVRGRL